MLSLVPVVVSDKFFFIDISYVKEIITKKEFFLIPKVPDFTVGVVNIRGEIIPAFNLSSLLFGSKSYLFKERFIDYLVLVYVDNKKMGFVVDKIGKVVYVDESNIKGYTENIWKDVRFLKFFVEVSEPKVLGGVLDIEGILKYIDKANKDLYKVGGKL
ncbi:MAG: chemotaxis protein CheW [Brevinematia bacterium]